MTIYYAHDADGAFIAGDTETGLTSYAYPTSPHAVDARTRAELVARAMLSSARLCKVPSAILTAYNERQWCRLAALCL